MTVPGRGLCEDPAPPGTTCARCGVVILPAAFIVPGMVYSRPARSSSWELGAIDLFHPGCWAAEQRRAGAQHFDANGALIRGMT